MLEGRVQRLSPGNLVTLFALDLTMLRDTHGTPGNILYFLPATREGTPEVRWRGNTYIPLPVRATGFEVTGRGALPRPRVTISNVGGLVTALQKQFDDIVGAKISRHRTFEDCLDDGRNPDPVSELRPDVWYVERKLNDNFLRVEYELASAMDLQGIKVPGRLMFYNSCPFTYEGRVRGIGEGECGYARGGNGDQTHMFDVNDVPLPDGPGQAHLDICGKRITSCLLRFGRENELDSGAFPGIQRTLR